MPKRKLTDEMYSEVVQAFQEYVLSTDDPLICEFISYNPLAIRYHVHDDDFTSPIYPKLREWALLCNKRSETYMLRKGMNGQSTAMSIFRLKQRQHGYTDRVEQNITSNGERVIFTNTLPRAAKEKSTTKTSK